MPRRPVLSQFTNIPQPAAIELAARRRMRAMEGTYPTVLEWDLRVQALELASGDARFAATTRARIAGGDLLAGEARADDPLGALRLAFYRLEEELECEQEGAHSRAARWLETVKRRLAQGRGVE